MAISFPVSKIARDFLGAYHQGGDEINPWHQGIHLTNLRIYKPHVKTNEYPPEKEPFFLRK